MDYGAGYFTLPVALTYTLIHDQLDPAEIARFTGMMLNDRTDGDTCTSMYSPATAPLSRRCGEARPAF